MFLALAAGVVATEGGHGTSQWAGGQANQVSQWASQWAGANPVSQWA
jgi:hypothetical protein